MMNRAKSFLAGGLVFFTLVSMLPQAAITAFADETTGTAEVQDISESNVFDALGIDTSDIPKDVDLFSTDNPYGRDSFVENAVYEILVQDSFNSTFLLGENNDLGGDPDKAAVGFSITPDSGKNYATLGQTTDARNVSNLSVPGEFDEGVTKTIAGHFNNKKDTNKSDLATVAITGTGNDASAYLYFSKTSSAQGGRITLVDGQVGHSNMGSGSHGIPCGSGHSQRQRRQTASYRHHHEGPDGSSTV